MHKIWTALGIFLAAAPCAMAQTLPMFPTASQPAPNSQMPGVNQLLGTNPPPAGNQPLASPPPATIPQPAGTPQLTVTQQAAATQKQVDPQPAKPPAPDASAYGTVVSPGILGVPLDWRAVPVVNRTWAGVDYMMWWFKDAPVPVPLATTSNAADGGIIGRPSTQVLFGNQALDAGTLSGVRLTVGHWLDNNEIIGVEAAGFFFAARSFTNFAAHSNNPNQILAVPYTDPVNGPAAFIISGTNPINGSPVDGSITASSSTSLWGAEINGLVNLLRSNNWQVNFLAGFRHINLQESLNMDYIVQVPGAGPLYNATLGDQFSTSNQFFGGQIGLKAEYTKGILFGSILGKVALGVNHETVSVNGQFSDPNGAFFSAYGAGGGGLFAQRTNIGSYTSDPFAVVPEVQLRLGVNLFMNLQLYVGYDLLYMSQAVRPGNQIDPVINPTQAGPNPAGGGTASPLVGPARPMPLVNESTFWAQGFTFGLQFAF